MKDIRCLLGHHKFSEWLEVDNHLERECLRCDHVEAKYPDPIVMLATLLLKYHMWKTTPKTFLPPSIGAFKPRDNR